MTKQQLENKIDNLTEVLELLIEFRPDASYLKFCLMMDDYEAMLEKISEGELEYE